MNSIDGNCMKLCSYYLPPFSFCHKGYVMRSSLFIVAAFLLLSNLVTYADGPADNKEEAVRAVPPPGITISNELREELDSGLSDLQTRLNVLRKSKSALVLKYLPDVEIFEKAIRIALTEDGFYEPKDFEGAKRVLAEGRRRMQLLLEEKPDWLKPNDQRDITTVRGFRSRIDGSIPSKRWSMRLPSMKWILRESPFAVFRWGALRRGIWPSITLIGGLQPIQVPVFQRRRNS